jgi:hypothetical protein
VVDRVIAISQNSVQDNTERCSGQVQISAVPDELFLPKIRNHSVIASGHMPEKLLAFIGNASARKTAGYEQKEIAEAFSITTT